MGTYGGKIPVAGAGCELGSVRPWRFLQVPAQNPDLSAVQHAFFFLLVELERSPQSDEQRFRSGEAHLGDELVPDLGIKTRSR